MADDFTPDYSLDEIIARKREAVAKRKELVPLSGVRAQASLQVRPLDIISTLREAEQLSLIAEIKRVTPGRGWLFTDQYDPVGLAMRLEASGAKGISVFTDDQYYQGGVDHLTLIKQAVKVPVLRNDFILDEYQLVEARAAGADGVVLMAAVLTDRELWSLLSLTQRLKMTALIQVHTEEELRRVLPLEPRLIGISNRDPRTLEVDLDATPRLRPLIPQPTVVVSMGGLRTPEDILMAAQAGVDGVIVGEALITADDPQAKIEELFSLIPPRKSSNPY